MNRSPAFCQSKKICTFYWIHSIALLSERRVASRHKSHFLISLIEENNIISFGQTFMDFWRRQWQPTPVFLPGEFHGQRSLAGYNPWRHKESDMAEWLTLSLFTFMHWRRKWQPTPVFLPGVSQGQQSLVGCHLWGRTESDMTEVT